MELRTNYKEIYDSLHGIIKISNYACRIIDTKEFQRLRYLHQLGTCNYVFPGATHTRYEHSLGTYFLAQKVLETIISNTDSDHLNKYMDEIDELKSYYLDKYKDQPHFKLDPYICELVKIAALCHDVGHGPFSHVFDDIFIKRFNFGKKEEYFDSHENRSCFIINLIINSDDALKNIIQPSHIKLIQKLINPPKNINHFLFQIVSNNFNSIDVDKFDYLSRDTYKLGLKYGIDPFMLISDMKVIENKICFPKKIYYEVISLFKTRYRLHKQVYSHKAVLSIQFMINDIMVLLDGICGFYNSINDMSKFVNLTDEYIISKLKILYENKDQYSEEDKQKIEKGYYLWEQINKRKLYKLVGSYASCSVVKFSPDDLVKMDPTIDLNNIIIYVSKIGFVSGAKKNPLNQIYFYNKKKSPMVNELCSKVDRLHMSFDVPKLYQEHIYMFFLKNREDANKEESLKIVLEKLFSQ